MPAAAVIPAPIAYIKVVAVKKLVVGFLSRTTDRLYTELVSGLTEASSWKTLFLHWFNGVQDFYFEEIRVFKTGVCREYFSME